MFEKREGIPRRKKLAILMAGLLAITTVAGYHHFIYLPEKREEERIRSLMEYAGLTREEAIRFDKKFKGYAPYNQTLLNFAYFLKRYPLTTSEIFRLTNSFPITVSSLKNTEPVISEIATGDKKGRDFVLKYPFLVLDDGLNATDAKLMLYDLDIKDLTSHIIERIKDQSSRITTLNLFYLNIQNKTLTERQALDFIKKYPDLLPLNYSSLVLAKYWPKVSDLIDFLISKYPVNIAKDSILLIYPNIQNETLTTEASINFITTYPDLVREGINPANLLYLKFYTRYPTLTDSVIKQMPYDLGIPLISNLSPSLLNNTFTENKAAYFISLYPHLARNFGLHEKFPRLIYLFTQIPKSTDVGIKTIEDFEFLVNTLNSVLRYTDETKKKEEKIAFFMERYPWLIKEYDWDKENVMIFEFHEPYPTLTDTLLRLKIKRDYVLSTIHNVRPYLKEIPESTINDFIKSYKHLVLDDGLNATDVRLLPYYHEYRLLTDTAIKELKDLDSILFVLDSYHPYIKKGEISSLRLRRYILEDGKLFRVKEYACPLADPDEDYMNNVTEMKILRDLFFGVGNFSWTPTKVVNDKVYEGDVYIRAKSVRGILPGKLHWIPINYTQFPVEVQLRAFPNETIREFDLIPVDGDLIDSIILIKDFRGGREYKIEIAAKDKAGNIAKASLTTPYIREFENIGKLLYDNGIIIAATYYPLYPDPHPWEGLEVRNRPILGYYSVTDPIVISKHIDWATGHSINTFFFSWGIYSDDELTLKVHRNILKILDHPLSKDIFISILYEFPHRARRADLPSDEYGFIYYDENKWQVILDDLQLIGKDFFNLPNYLKVDGKPVIYIYESKALSKDSLTNVEQAINRIRETVKNTTYLDIYLICDLPHAPFGLYFDGWTIWAGNYVRDRLWSLEEVERVYEERSYEAKRYNRDFWPSMIPGFTDPRSPPLYPLPRNATRFRDGVKIGLRYGFLKDYTSVIRIDTYNEWGEDTGIEPTFEEGFIYLQTLLDVLKNIKKSQRNKKVSFIQNNLLSALTSLQRAFTPSSSKKTLQHRYKLAGYLKRSRSIVSTSSTVTRATMDIFHSPLRWNRPGHPL